MCKICCRSAAARLAAVVLEISVNSILLAPALAGLAIAADQPAEGVPSVGPLRRGANGEIEVVKPADLKRNVTCPGASPTPVTSVADQFRTLQPGHWMDVSNSHLGSTVYHGPLANSLFGNSGPGSIMGSWSGGTFDPVSNSLIVWGGGHKDYYGNAVYAFNLRKLTWSMLDNPSSIAGWNSTGSPILPDGSPSAQHTYDALTFLPSLNEMFVAGSQAATTNGNSYRESWLFNVATGTWRQAAPYSTALVGGIAAYNSADSLVYAINAQPNSLKSYNATTNTWTTIGSGHLADYHMTGAIDPGANIMVAVGHGYLQSVSLTTGATSTLSSTGDQTVQNGNAPGFVWDPAANLFVGWNGGSSLSTLDPQTWQWTTYFAAPDNSVTPTAPAANGTFGRFQYDAADNVFIVVNDVNQDVYLYKPCF
jgi:hypothetical protein